MMNQKFNTATEYHNLQGQPAYHGSMVALMTADHKTPSHGDGGKEEEEDEEAQFLYEHQLQVMAYSYAHTHTATLYGDTGKLEACSYGVSSGPADQLDMQDHTVVMDSAEDQEHHHDVSISHGELVDIGHNIGASERSCPARQHQLHAGISTTLPSPARQELMPEITSSPSLMYSSSYGVHDGNGSGGSDPLKEKIIGHPQYHKLVMAYMNCRKIGAPPDVVERLEELGKEYLEHPQLLKSISKAVLSTSGAGDGVPDPELDHFMDMYCHVLQQYHEKLSKPFNEAMEFLQKVELQMNYMTKTHDLGSAPKQGLIVENKDREELEDAEEEEESCGEVDFENVDANMDQQILNEDKQLKEKLLRKYRGYISPLRHEFMKKKKKGKLPKDARQRLLDWWNEHYKWPYPSEAEKACLAQSTGLDQKQINNWFINQRKRHWKPSDQDMRYVMVNGQDLPMQDLRTTNDIRG